MITKKISGYIILFFVGFWVLNIIYPLVSLFIYDLLTGDNTWDLLFLPNTPNLLQPEVIFGLYTLYVISVVYNISKFYGMAMLIIYFVIVFNLFKRIQSIVEEV